jgi:hypothetical protein
MSRFAKLLRTPVPLNVFRVINTAIFPLVLMFVWAYRVWSTASTPF